MRKLLGKFFISLGNLAKDQFNFLYLDSSKNIYGKVKKSMIHPPVYGEGDYAIFEDVVLSSRVLGSPTYKSLGEFIDSRSAGVITMGDITAGSGVANVPDGKGFIKITDDEMGITKFFDWPAKKGVILVDQQLNYVYVDYNNGNPIIADTAVIDFHDINGRTQVCVGVVFRKGDIVEIFQRSGTDVSDFIYRAWKRLEHRGIEIMSGGLVSEIGERYIGVTAAEYYRGYVEKEITGKNTSGIDRYTAVYKDGSGGWIYESGLQQFSNILYDDGDGNPGDVGAAKYATYYVYQGINGYLYIQYGQGGSNNLAQAQTESIPVPPTFLVKGTLLRAKIIIIRDATNAYSIENYGIASFQTFAATLHNFLAGLQGGAVDEYYHLTNEELLQLQTIPLNIQNQSFVYYNDTGILNKCIITPTPAVTAYQEGQKWSVKIANTNTGPVTLDVNGKGERGIKKEVDGILQNLEAGDLRAGVIYEFTDLGVAFQLMGGGVSEKLAIVLAIVL